MKITLIRKDYYNKSHMSIMTIDRFIQRIKFDTKDGGVSGLRWFVDMNTDEPGVKYWNMHKLARVYPAVWLHREKDDTYTMKEFNNLVVLDVNNLDGSGAVEKVKKTVRCLPSTLAAFMGSSGRSVKILVAVATAKGVEPRTVDDATAFYRRAYQLASNIYNSILPYPITQRDVSGSLLPLDTATHEAFSFRMTLDEQPYYNSKAAPIIVPEMMDEDMIAHPASTEKVEDTITTITDEKALLREAITTERISRNTQRLIDFLCSRFEFRYNTVFSYAEYRPIHSHAAFRPVDERSRNSFAMDARLAGIDVWDKDINRFVTSNKVKSYSPIHEYLSKAYGKWDRKDHIRALARTVPNNNPHWEDWFYTWFLGMVAQWMGRASNYGNSTAPLLISRQGYNKSTFCKSLIPDKLQWGYLDNLLLGEKKAVLQAMSQMLLINLDEFNSISPSIQQGFLKNVIQLANVKIKRPYGRHVEVFPRLASFIATANVTDILADPSGCRRFIGVELTGPIRIAHHINHEQLYAQAVEAILDEGEQYWFDTDQTALIMESNRRFQMHQPVEQLFFEYFEVCDSEQQGEYLTAAAVMANIKSKAGSIAGNANLMSFGRWLANLDGIRHRRSNQGTQYLLKRKDA